MQTIMSSCFLIYFFVGFYCQWRLSYAATLETELCTARHLMMSEEDSIRMMSDMISPMSVDSFFSNVFEKQSTAILDRPPVYYSSLMSLDIVLEYLQRQGQLPNLLGSDKIKEPKAGILNFEDNKIQHGGDWKLVRRVWRNGDWWSSSPNVSVIPFEVVLASFQRHGYSIVINKIQDFYPPLKKVTAVLESLFGHKVNANLYLTPPGVKQAFETHFDWMDGIIVQITGCKRWKVYSSPSAVRPLSDTVFKLTNENFNPKMGGDPQFGQQSPRNYYDDYDDYDDYEDYGSEKNDKKKKNRKSSIAQQAQTQTLKFKEYELGPGSLLYIPRGYAHEAATNCSRRSRGRSKHDGSPYLSNSDSEEISPSLHITFGLETATDTTVEIFVHHYIDVYFKNHDGRRVVEFRHDDLGVSSSNSRNSSRVHNGTTDSVCSDTETEGSVNETIKNKHQDNNRRSKAESQSQSQSQSGTNASLEEVEVRYRVVGENGSKEGTTSDDGNSDPQCIQMINFDGDTNLHASVREIRSRSGGGEADVHSTSSRALPLSDKVSLILISSSFDLSMKMGGVSLSDIFHLVVHVATVIDKKKIDCQQDPTNTSQNTKDCSDLAKFENFLFETHYEKEINPKSPKKGKSPKKSILDYIGRVSPSILRRAIAVTEYTAKNRYQPMIYDLIPATVQYLKQFLHFYTPSDILLKSLILGLNMGKISVSLDNVDFSNSTASVDNKRGKTSTNGFYPATLTGLNFVRYFISSSPAIQITSGTNIPYVHTLENNENMIENDSRMKWFLNLLLDHNWDSVSIIDGDEKEINLSNLFERFLKQLLDGISTEEKKVKRGRTGNKNDDKTKGDYNDIGANDVISVDVEDIMVKENRNESVKGGTSSHLYCTAWEQMIHRLEYRRSYRH